MKCVEDFPYPVLHVRPKSRPPTPDPYGVPPNIKKQRKLKKIAVKQSIRVAEPKQAMPLQVLNLSQNSVGCQGFSAFLSCLARRGIHDTLIELDLSRTDIAVAGGRVLAQFLSKCLFIQKLDCRLVLERASGVPVASVRLKRFCSVTHNLETIFSKNFRWQ